MSNTTSKFITTFNQDTANLLLKMGFKQLKKDQNTGHYIFINEPNKVMFEKIDDVAYTNMLSF